jgi:hypothetical protein
MRNSGISTLLARESNSPLEDVSFQSSEPSYPSVVAKQGIEAWLGMELSLPLEREQAEGIANTRSARSPRPDSESVRER